MYDNLTAVNTSTSADNDRSYTFGIGRVKGSQNGYMSRLKRFCNRLL